MLRRSLITAAMCFAATPVLAQNAWPAKPVKIVVPTGPGSSLDLIVRAMSDKLGARWDRKMPYDPAKDLVPVVMTTSQPNVLAVNADKVPAKTVAEFVTWAKAQGGKMNYSSLGNGSSAHLTMELFLAESGVAATHVPFNGSPPAAMAVAQGEADATFMVAPALLPHVKNNKVRLLAVSAKERPESLKDVPTLAASGYPNVESLAWNGLFASPGTPDAVLSRINADVNEVLKDAAVKSALDAQGLTTVGGSAADFKRVIDGDVKRWGPVIDKLGVKLD
jgi:tripartite-type tricarboxylate transporter receptor subunit TctC